MVEAFSWRYLENCLGTKIRMVFSMCLDPGCKDNMVRYSANNVQSYGKNTCVSLKVQTMNSSILYTMKAFAFLFILSCVLPDNCSLTKTLSLTSHPTLPSLLIRLILYWKILTYIGTPRLFLHLHTRNSLSCWPKTNLQSPHRTSLSQLTKLR